MKSRIQELSQFERKVNIDLGHIFDDMKMSAGKDQINSINDLLKRFVDKDELDAVKQRLFNYQTISESVEDKRVMNKQFEDMDWAIRLRAMRNETEVKAKGL